jgi:hypothetical protein
MTIADNVQEKSKISFPTWKSLVIKISEEYETIVGIKDNSLTKRCLEILKQLDKFNPEIQGNSIEFIPSHAYDLTSKSQASHKTGENVSDVIKQIEALSLGNNEFYTLFDVSKNEHIKVGENVKEYLGIEPSEFNVASLSGQNPENPLFHPQDLFHYVRCGIVTYYVVTLPGFAWPANKDFYRSRFRVSTAGSKNEIIKNLKYVTLEKKAYLCHDQKTEDLFIPTLHLIRWTVLEMTEFNGIEPYFSSDPIQAKYRNLLFYLLNAYLVGLSTKYTAILNLSMQCDRNKEIAQKLSESVQRLSNIDNSFDEKSIGDCFAKSIRPKMTSAIGYWERRYGQVSIDSDFAAMQAGKSLSILPMPDKIYEMICSSAT